MDEQMNFGTYIKSARVKAKISQRDLAEQAGIDFTYLSKIENGRMAPPSEETIRKIANILGEDAETLIILADKIPSNYKQVLQSNPKVPMLLRTLGETSLNDDKLERLLKQIQDFENEDE